MELTFEFADKAKWKTGKFVFDDLQIVGADDDVEVEYNDIQLYLDDKLYEGGINTWSTDNLSADALFEDVLNSYLRNNTGEFKSFGPEWSVFSEILDMTEKDGDLVMKLPVYNMGFHLYELDLATPDTRYYSYDDNFIVLDNNGEIITDYEEFYSEAMIQDLRDIITGKTKCLYMGYNPKAWIEECGGEQGFLEEFG
jgi:hypothetical protein